MDLSGILSDTNNGTNTLPIGIERVIATVEVPFPFTIVEQNARFLDENQRAQIQLIIESALDVTLKDNYFPKISREEAQVYMAKDANGSIVSVAIVIGNYLCKFATKTELQNRKIGGTLFNYVNAEHPELFWRSRPDRLINPWYERIADPIDSGGLVISNDNNKYNFYSIGVKDHDLNVAVQFVKDKESDYKPHVNALRKAIAKLKTGYESVVSGLRTQLGGLRSPASYISITGRS